jgi:hypothetical protein
MSKEELVPWIEKLKAEPDKKRQNEIVADLCKEKGLKTGDAWKLLKEARFEPNASPNSGQGNNQGDGGQDAKKIPVLVSHKTGYEKYRCAGLALTRKPENYLVSEAQFEKLKRDPWVVIAT